MARARQQQMLRPMTGVAGREMRGSTTTISHIAAESLFHIVLAMRAAYPYRSSYDRGSRLTVDLAVAYGERLLRGEA